MDPSRASRPGDDDAIVLDLLTAIERDGSASQRSLSKDLGIALGTVNWHLKRCVRKGLVKVSQAPLRRYAYYLTPQGFEEKGRLTIRYVQVSLALFRHAKSDFRILYAMLAERGYRRAVLVGGGELSEAAILAAADAPIVLLAVVDFGGTEGSFAGLPLLSSLNLLRTPGVPGPVAVIVANLDAPGATWARAEQELERLGLETQNLYAPRLLRLAEPAPALIDGKD